MANLSEFSGNTSNCSPDVEHVLREKIYGVIDFLDSPVSSPHVPCKALEGVVAYVDVRSDQDNRSEAIERQLLRLGATIVPKLSNDVTHVVFKDGRKLTCERAKRWNLHLVSVLWVESCKQTQERVPESLFPINKAQEPNTPLCVPKLKKTKSMQPKDFDVDLANSAERADKRRKRRSLTNKKSENQTPSKLAFFVAETQDISPVPVKYTPNITIPDTPPSMKDLIQRLRNRHLEPSEESEEQESPSPSVGAVKTTPLQRRLFDSGNGEISYSPSSPVRLSGGMPAPAVGESPSKATSASPRSSYSPGGAHVPKLHLQESPKDVVPAFDLVGHFSRAVRDGNCDPDNCDVMETQRKSSITLTVGREETQPESVIHNQSKVKCKIPADRECGEIKRRKSARLSCLKTTPAVESTDLLNRRSRRRSEMPKDLPLLEEPVHLFETVDGGNSAKVTADESGLNPSRENFKSVVDPHRYDKDKTGESVIIRKTRRSSAAFHRREVTLYDISPKVQTKAVQKQEKVKGDGGSSKEDIQSDLPMKNHAKTKTSIRSKPTGSGDEMDSVRDPISLVIDTKNTVSKRHRKKNNDAMTQRVSNEGEHKIVVNENHGKVDSRKSLRSSFCSGSSKARQSIEEFSAKNYNVTLSRKIHSQSVSQKLSEDKDSTVLNMRKRNLASREQSMSCIASQLETTALSASKQRAGYPSKNRTANSSVSVGKPKPASSLVMTSLHYDEQDVVESVVKKLGCFSVRDTVSLHTTHVICGKKRRTLNVLHAIAQGCWLLSYEWVLKSLEAGKWLDETPYEMDYFPAAKKSRLMQKEFGRSCNIFENCGSVFVSERTIPSKSHIVKLLKKCSGQVTSDSEDADIVVGDMYHAHGGTNVTEQWVLDSVSSFQCADFRKYQLKQHTVERSESPQY